MMEPSELDLAQLKYEMRQLYHNTGYEGCTQILYEMMLGAQILATVIVEEKAKENLN